MHLILAFIISTITTPNVHAFIVESAVLLLGNVQKYFYLKSDNNAASQICNKKCFSDLQQKMLFWHLFGFAFQIHIHSRLYISSSKISKSKK